MIPNERVLAPAAPLLEGAMLTRAKDFGGAAKAYRTAFDRAPGTATATRLVAALKRAGQPKQAIELLREWSEKNPDDAVVRSLYAAELQQTGEKESAAANYEALLEANASNVIALNNLAWLYHERGDDRALDFARRAYELRPERPEILDTYGWLLVRSGKLQQGLGLLREAAQAAPAHPEIVFHYASALAYAGDRSEAADQLQKLLAGSAEFEGRDRAEALLRRLR